MNRNEILETAGKRRAMILVYILKYHEENGFSPTIEEIGKAVGLKSKSSVCAHLNTLEEKGLICRKRCRPRTVLVNRDK